MKKEEVSNIVAGIVIGLGAGLTAYHKKLSQK